MPDNEKHIFAKSISAYRANKFSPRRNNWRNEAYHVEMQSNNEEAYKKEVMKMMTHFVFFFSVELL